MLRKSTLFFAMAAILLLGTIHIASAAEKDTSGSVTLYAPNSTSINFLNFGVGDANVGDAVEVYQGDERIASVTVTKVMDDMAEASVINWYKAIGAPASLENCRVVAIQPEAGTGTRISTGTGTATGTMDTSRPELNKELSSLLGEKLPGKRYPTEQIPSEGYPAERFPAQPVPAERYPSENYSTQQTAATQYPTGTSPTEALPPVTSPTGTQTTTGSPYGYGQPPPGITLHDWDRMLAGGFEAVLAERIAAAGSSTTTGTYPTGTTSPETLPPEFLEIEAGLVSVIDSLSEREADLEQRIADLSSSVPSTAEAAAQTLIDNLNEADRDVLTKLYDLFKSTAIADLPLGTVGASSLTFVSGGNTAGALAESLKNTKDDVVKYLTDWRNKQKIFKEEEKKELEEALWTLRDRKTRLEYLLNSKIRKAMSSSLGY